MDGRTVGPRALLALIALPVVLLACAGAGAGAPARDDLTLAEGQSLSAERARLGLVGVDAASPDGAPQFAADQESQADATLIIRTGSLRLEVADVAATLVRAEDLVATLGGYMSASEVLDQGGQLTANVSYRIPVQRLQEAVDGLRALGDRLVYESTQAEEVTSQVVDLRARITNLRASETALLDIMERAGSIEDVLAVQLRLQDVRQEIERLVAQQQDLEGRAAMATLSVSWDSPRAAVAKASSGWDLGAEIDEAAAQTVSAAQGLVSALVWLVVVGVPVFGPVILVGLAALFLVRRTRAHRLDTSARD